MKSYPDRSGRQCGSSRNQRYLFPLTQLSERSYPYRSGLQSAWLRNQCGSSRNQSLPFGTTIRLVAEAMRKLAKPIPTVRDYNPIGSGTNWEAGGANSEPGGTNLEARVTNAEAGGINAEARGANTYRSGRQSDWLRKQCRRPLIKSLSL